MSYAKKIYKEKVIKELLEKYKYKSIMEVPKIEKIVINRGMGEVTQNSKVAEASLEELKNISGQKPLIRPAKKAISNFKLRKGQPVGCMVTLRSDRMFDFLTKLINIIMPNIRDFRGLPSGFDGRGNYNFGIKESIIFPEVNYEKVDKIRGMNITIVTSAKTDQEAYDLLSLLGMPFRTQLKKTKINQG
jgi:large subunit ribosomal protein L5